MFSVLILTKNEEANLPDCLASVAWCDDVVVLDSFSDDKTCEIASANGARVVQRAFDDFGSHRNHALDTISFRHPWVFHLDADERFNEGLRAECGRVIRENRHSGYFVPNRIFFLGRWIRHCTQYPYPQVRLVRVGEVRFVRAGHGQREDHALRGVGHIQTPYDHFNFSKGVRDWVEKHNRYSDQEAAEFVMSGGDTSIRPSDLVAADGMARKRVMKQLHARLPMRWLLKFSYLYFWKRGFLDGYPGFAYCLLQAFYDFLIALKIRELRQGTRQDGERRAET